MLNAGWSGEGTQRLGFAAQKAVRVAGWELGGSVRTAGHTDRAWGAWGGGEDGVAGWTASDGVVDGGEGVGGGVGERVGSP